MVKFRRYPKGYFFKKLNPMFGKSNISYKPKKYNRNEGKPLPFKYVLLLSFVFFLISSSIGLWVVNKGIRPTLEAYAKSYSINLATSLMERAVNEELGAGLSLDEIITVVPTGVGNGTLTAFDTQKILEVSNSITSNILNNINRVEDGHTSTKIVSEDGEVVEIQPSSEKGIHFRVPFGRITDNVILANLGPDISIEFQAIGDVKTDYEAVVKNNSINSSWYEIWLHIEVGVQMLVPFNSEVQYIPKSILLASGEVKGEVPQFYSNGQLYPSIVVPQDEKNSQSSEE
jgi:sporulation protein YunB